MIPGSGCSVLVLGYLDPGSGSLLLQVLIAGLLTGLFLLKSSWETVRHSVGRLFRKSPPGS